MSTSNQTQDHQAIKQWVETRNGVPARVVGTEINGDEGILRIHFPEFSKSDGLEEIDREDNKMIVGVLVTYAVIQFFQTYLLEPLIVGEQININPLFTILVIVLGEMIWGVAGMLLAIPLLGMVKIVCDHVADLQPYGFLIGTEKQRGRNTGVIDTIKSAFQK